jgi:hypothetical protein
MIQNAYGRHVSRVGGLTGGFQGSFERFLRDSPAQHENECTWQLLCTDTELVSSSKKRGRHSAVRIAEAALTTRLCLSPTCPIGNVTCCKACSDNLAGSACELMESAVSDSCVASLAPFAAVSGCRQCLDCFCGACLCTGGSSLAGRTHPLLAFPPTQTFRDMTDVEFKRKGSAFGGPAVGLEQMKVIKSGFLEKRGNRR